MTVSTVFGSAFARTALAEHDFTTTRDEIAFAEVAPIHKAFPAVVRGEYDAAELALVTFLQAYDNGMPVVLLPVTLLGRFQHHTLVTTLGEGEISADQLAGKRIGVRAWSQTTGVWVRGFLCDDFGLDVESVEWVVYEGGHVDGFVDPPYARRSTSGNRLPADFLAGAVDAAILGNELPDDPRARTVLPDPARSAAGWFGRSGALPVNHVAMVSESFAREHGDTAAEIARVIAGAASHPPAISSTIDLYPAGFDALAPSLDAAGRYAFEQGITSRVITTDEIRERTQSLTGVDMSTLEPLEVPAA